MTSLVEREAGTGIIQELSVERQIQQAFETSGARGCIRQEICFGNTNASKIFIAIAGSLRDGAVEILTPAQLAAYTEGLNGSCSTSPLPTVPEYVTAIIKTISNMTLPWHQLCILVSIQSNTTGILHEAFENIVYTDVVAVISNYLFEKIICSETVLSTYNVPTLYFESSQHAGGIPANTVSDRFNYGTMNRQFWEQLQFNVSPDHDEFISMFLEFLTVMGWENIAVILPKGGLLNNDKMIVQSGQITVYFSVFQPDNPASTFGYMAQYEITVVLYHGEPDEYIEVLEMAAKNDFTDPG